MCSISRSPIQVRRWCLRAPVIRHAAPAAGRFARFAHDGALVGFGGSFGMLRWARPIPRHAAGRRSRLPGRFHRLMRPSLRRRGRRGEWRPAASVAAPFTSERSPKGAAQSARAEPTRTLRARTEVVWRRGGGSDAGAQPVCEASRSWPAGDLPGRAAGPGAARAGQRLGGNERCGGGAWADGERAARCAVRRSARGRRGGQGARRGGRRRRPRRGPTAAPVRTTPAVTAATAPFSITPVAPATPAGEESSATLSAVWPVAVAPRDIHSSNGWGVIAAAAASQRGTRPVEQATDSAVGDSPARWPPPRASARPSR